MILFLTNSEPQLLFKLSLWLYKSVCGPISNQYSSHKFWVLGDGSMWFITSVADRLIIGFLYAVSVIFSFWIFH
jgi:hypothetical protein